MLILKSTDKFEHGIPFTVLQDLNDVVYSTIYEVQCQY